MERHDPSRLNDRLVYSAMTQTFVPLMQVIDRVDIISEDVLIHRRNRVRTLTAQAEPAPGLTADTANKSIIEQIEAIELPAGYTMEWGGNMKVHAMHKRHSILNYRSVCSSCCLLVFYYLVKCASR